MTTSPTQWSPSDSAPPDPPTRRNRVATFGFILSLIGLAFSFAPILGFIVLLPALAVAIMGYRRPKTGKATTRGKSVPAIVLASVGLAICLAMTTWFIASGAASAPRPTASVSAPVPAPAPTPVPLPAPVLAPAPVLLSVPNVVGFSDEQARQALLAAGFTNVRIGPSTGSFAGVAASTVTTQLPQFGARASAGDPITLGEAEAPPPPAVAPPAPAPAPSAEASAVPTAEPVPQRQPDAPSSAGTGSTGSGSSGSAYYANCTAAKAAGAAPLYQGQPGYSSKLDRDGDGVACEK